jgi:hypothetical protein
MMWSKRGLVVAAGLTAILVCCVPHVERAKPHAIRIHDTVMVTVKEISQPVARSRLNLQPNGSSVAEYGTITYHVAAAVVDVLPDGILVLKAHKSIPDDKNPWEYTLTGKIRREDISPDRTALSEHIADLSISKVQRAELHDSSNWAWFVHLCNLMGLL